MSDARDGNGFRGISAITLGTHDMAAAVSFYERLGFRCKFGGPEAEFTSFFFGSGFLNLVAQPGDRRWAWWGRVVMHVDDVDAVYERALGEGLHPHAPPRDAEWQERYFHITDPDGHELSFATPLE